MDILSARNNEVEKLNEMFEVVFPYSKINDKDVEERMESVGSKGTQEDKLNSSGKKNPNFYSENTE